MEKNVTLGKTGMVVNKNGFGALPIQRISQDEAVGIIRKAYENGINFFDTARFYTDSEEKLGHALKDVRQNVYIASKTMCQDTDQFWAHLDKSLHDLQTDYIDLYQFHNLPFCPKPDDGTGLYEAMLEAKAQGKIRHIGITNHRLPIALEAIGSDLYETLQFPFSYLASDEDISLSKKCHEANMGFIAMKALSGGLITNAQAAYAFCADYDYVLPIWGIQKMEQLEQFLNCQTNPPKMDEQMVNYINSEKEKLSGDFCRGCGYCMPCPAGIKIDDCARMSLLIRRAPIEIYMNDNFQAEMDKILTCLHCDLCKSKCPYQLDTPSLLEKNLNDYQDVLAGRTIL